MVTVDDLGGVAYLPLLLEDESGITHGNDWANGFLRGMEFGREDWTLLLEDEDHGGSLVAIFASANENTPIPKCDRIKIQSARTFGKL